MVLSKSVYAIAEEAAQEADKASMAALAQASDCSMKLIEEFRRDREMYLKETCAKYEEKAVEEEKRLAKIRSQQDNFKVTEPRRPEISIEFECGFDVQFQAVWNSVRISCDRERRYGYVSTEFTLETRNVPYAANFGTVSRLVGARYMNGIFIRSIELKPQMGEDFPSVLRQMKQNGAEILVVDRFESESCSLEQVRGIFGNKKIVLLSDIKDIQSRETRPAG